MVFCCHSLFVGFAIWAANDWSIATITTNHPNITTKYSTKYISSNRSKPYTPKHWPHPPNTLPKAYPKSEQIGTLKATPMRSKPKRKAYSAPKTPRRRKDVKATWRLPDGCPLGWQFGKCHEATAATNLGIQNFSKGINQPHPPAWTIPTQNFPLATYFFYQPQEI